uniref:Androgen dependent TFPI regulating protein n=1 Tax=Pseudonaja textilis TaxID=8673 RepID=A0A670XNY4_PSETE
MHPSARLVYYGVVFAWYTFFFYACSYFVANVDESRIAEGKFNPFVGSHWKYLSFLNVVLQVVFYAVSLLTSAFILMKKQRTATFMISFKDLIFSSLVFPLSTFVFATFWSMYLYDRDLLYPKYMDSIIPGWVNHGMVSKKKQLNITKIVRISYAYYSS